MSVAKRLLVLGFFGCTLLRISSPVTANPDETGNQGKFLRGDTNNDGKDNVSDAVFLLNYLFGGGESPPCNPVADINDDGKRNISDAVFLLMHLFKGESAPPEPFPGCGVDPGGKTCPASACNE
jgi:hypothetical protein